MLLCIENSRTELENLVLRFEVADAEKVMSASTVEGGLKCLREHREEIDVVVTDLHFGPHDPEGGLRVVREGVHAGLPVIVLTGFGSVSTAVSALESGAFSYVEKALPGGGTYPLLKQKIARAREVAQLRRTAAAQELTIELQQRRLHADLERARELQLSWVPSDFQKCGWAVCVHWRPSEAVGGDFISVVEPPAGKSFSLVIGDAMGHGVAAALMAARLKGDIESAARAMESPRGLVRKLRGSLDYLTGAQQLPLVCIQCSLDGTVEYSNAGHPAPLHVDGLGWRQLPEGGPVIAEISANADESGGSVKLQPGECLVLYSDGLFKAVDDEPSRLLVRLQEELPAVQEAQGLLSYLSGMMEGVQQDDDVLIAVVERVR